MLGWLFLAIAPRKRRRGARLPRSEWHRSATPSPEGGLCPEEQVRRPGMRGQPGSSERLLPHSHNRQILPSRHIRSHSPFAHSGADGCSFAILRETYPGKALPIESAVVTAAQIAIEPEDQRGLQFGAEGAGCLGNVAGDLPGR